jgi:hypothetical protein
MQSLNCWLCALVLLLTSATTISVNGAADQESSPDWPKLAKQIVRTDLRLEPGERVILQYLPGKNPLLIEALRDEITLADGIISAELVWPSPAMGKYLDELSPAQKLQRVAAEDVVYRELFAHSDVYLWLDESGFEDLVPRRFEHLIADSHVRAIHSHWVEPPDAKDHDRVWRMYERAIELDPRDIDARLTPLEMRLRGAHLRLTSADGANLTFDISQDAWFHHNTGEASRAKVATARSVRDREEELPAGVLRTTAVSGANGKLVATVFSASKTDAVEVTFRQGVIVNVEPRGGNGNEFAKWFRETKGDRDRVSELVIGTNPLLPILPSGFMPYYGYGAGIIRIAVGENWESGGPLRTSDHQEWWLYVTNGTLTADKTTVIKNGVMN